MVCDNHEGERGGLNLSNQTREMMQEQMAYEVAWQIGDYLRGKLNAEQILVYQCFCFSAK